LREIRDPHLGAAAESRRGRRRARRRPPRHHHRRAELDEPPRQTARRVPAPQKKVGDTHQLVASRDHWAPGCICVFSSIAGSIVRSWTVRALLVMVLVGCAGRETGFQPERDDPAAAADLASYRAVFELAWNGAPVGEARERLDAVRGGGVRFERREVWQVRRAAALVRGELTVEIAATADLEATRVEVGGSGATGTAVRQGDGWLVEVAGEPPRLARGMPVEILPLYLAHRGRDRWAGPVLFAGLGFAPAYARVLPDGEAHRLVEISGPAGKLAVRVSLEADGTVATAIGPDMSAHRVRAAALPRPPDLLALGAIDVAGAPGPE